MSTLTSSEIAQSAYSIYEIFNNKSTEARKISTWIGAAETIKTEYIFLVEAIMSGITDAQSLHQKWARYMMESGWKYDNRYLPSLRTHPELTEYENTSDLFKFKLNLFIEVVECLSKY